MGADIAGPFGVGLEAAGHVRMLQRFLDAEDDRLGRVEPLLDAHGFLEGTPPQDRRGVHEAEQRVPVDHAAARQPRGPAVGQAQAVLRDEHVAAFVQPTPPRTSEHLEDLVGLDGVLDVVAPVGITREDNAAEGEVDASREAHRRDDDAELAGLGQRLDHAGARRVAQAAVVVGHPRLEHPGHLLADDLLLLGRELERIRVWQITRKLGGERFRGAALRGEDEDGSEILGEGLGHEARPVALDLGGDEVVQAVAVDLLQWHGPFPMSDEHGTPAEAREPFHDVFGVGHAAAEQEELRLRRRERDGQLVVQAAIGVPDHLILVDHEQRGAVAADEPVLLRLQRGDDDGGFEILGEVSRGDADVPTTRAPFGELVIGQRAGGDGVDGLAAVLAVVRPQLKHEGLARAGGSMDDDVLSIAQRGHGLLLPEVRHGHLVQRRGRRITKVAVVDALKAVAKGVHGRTTRAPLDGEDG